MKQEEKELLLKDLCARLPYGVKMLFNNKHKFILSQINPRQFAGKDGYGVIFDFGGKTYSVEDCKPYLRPMSSMTEDELKEFVSFTSQSMHRFICESTNIDHWYNVYEEEDWLNAHHFDYRGLIEKSLALEAPEGMYEI